MMHDQNSSITTTEKVRSNQKQSTDELHEKEPNGSNSSVPNIKFEDRISESNRLFDTIVPIVERRCLLTHSTDPLFLRICAVGDAGVRGERIRISAIDYLCEVTFSSTASDPFSVYIDWGTFQTNVDPESPYGAVDDTSEIESNRRGEEYMSEKQEIKGGS